MAKSKNEPRSIRLNKDHRADMLNAVMEQWEKTNPPPAGARFEDFIKETLRSLKKVPARAPAEQKAFMQLIKRTRDAKKFRDTIPANLKDHVTLAEEADFRLEIRLADGGQGAVYRFKIPRAMAEELNIPYLRVDKCSGRYNEEFSSYLEHDLAFAPEKSLEYVYMANAGSRNVITIPRDSKPYAQYRKSQRALNLWEEEKRKVRDEINDYLSQFSTTGQIREMWPEMEQYLPAHIADPSKVIKLPALTRSRLNERLGI